MPVHSIVYNSSYNVYIHNVFMYANASNIYKIVVYNIIWPFIIVYEWNRMEWHHESFMYTYKP